MADLAVDDENYASSEDSDFAPDKVPEPVSSGESDDDDDNDNAAQTTTKATKGNKRKRAAAAADGEAEDVGFENSGDEAIISRGKKKRRRKAAADGDNDDNDDDNDQDGGVGGFVKTRSQRANEKAERRVAAVQGPVTVDVDALWAQMTAKVVAAPPPQDNNNNDHHLASLATSAVAATAAAAAAAAATETADTGTAAVKAAPSSGKPKQRMVKIRRTYNFAGKVHTEEKRVARDSAEAKLYFAELGQEVPEEGGEKEEEDDDDDDNDSDSDSDADNNKRAPPRKAFRSAFEPVLDAALLAVGGARADLDLGLRARLLARAQQQQQRLHARAAAKKLTTVEKSRMDWAGFVDREGLQDELVLAGKAKGAFADRQQFLARTDMLRDEEARRARLAGKT